MVNKDDLFTLKLDFGYNVEKQEERVPKFMEFKDGKLIYYNFDYEQLQETQKAFTRFPEILTALGDSKLDEIMGKLPKGNGK